METLSVMYAAVGYLALVAAILGGMLFVGDGVVLPHVQATMAVVPSQTVWVDLGLLILMAAVHKSASRGVIAAVAEKLIPKNLERGSQAWVAAAVLFVLIAFWQPVPKVVWDWAGPLQWLLSGLSYVGWTLIFVGVLASHFDMLVTQSASGETREGAFDKSFAEILGEPVHSGVLLALWATPSMTVGHLLVASTVTAYSLLDASWAVWKSGRDQEARAMSFQG